MQSVEGPSPQGPREGGRRELQPLGFHQGPEVPAAAGGGCGGPGEGGCPPALRLGQKGVPGPGSGYLAWHPCSRLPARPSCWRPHPPPAAGRPESYFRRLPETRPVWPDRGTAPAHRALPARPPWPCLPVMTHALVGPLAASVQGSPRGLCSPSPCGEEALPYREQVGARPWGSLLQPHSSPPPTPHLSIITRLFPARRETPPGRSPGGLGPDVVAQPPDLSGLPGPGCCPSTMACPHSDGGDHSGTSPPGWPPQGLYHPPLLVHAICSGPGSQSPLMTGD